MNISRVLLLMPPNVTVIEPFSSSGVEQPILSGFPMGLGYIASYLRANDDVEVSILDGTLDNPGLDEMCRRIGEFKPDAVGMTLYTRTVKVAIALAELIRERLPGTVLIAGGPHASDDYESLLRHHPVFDFVVVGEGEVTMLELLRFLRLHGVDGSPPSFPGLAYKHPSSGEVIFTGRRPYVDDIDSLPEPARDLVDFGRYIHAHNLLPHAVEIMGSRGCTHRCAFCSFQRRWRGRRPEAVVAELKELVRRHPKIRSFLFFDDNFSADQARVESLCNLLIEEGLNRCEWSALCRADQVTGPMLGLMRRAGCRKIMFGVESADPGILKTLDKHLELDDVRRACSAATRAGMDALAFFVIGSPGETLETIERSRKFAVSLACRSTQWGIMQVYPGTKLARMQPCEDFAGYLYEPEVHSPAPGGLHACVPTFENPGLGREDLKREFERVYRRITLRKAIQHPLFTLRKLAHNPSVAGTFVTRFLVPRKK
ncbi:MAG: radical SAM protein [Lentisphaerae bacterium]|nr:radical SAM protein [Lentisphaerota bacterium]